MHNFLELPKTGEMRNLLARNTTLLHYKERWVGPPEFNSVSVTLFGQKC